MALKESIRAWNEAVQEFEQKHYRVARDKFNALAEKNAKIYFNLASCSFCLKDPKAAAKFLKIALEKDKHFLIGHFQLGVAHFKRNRFSKALENFQQAYVVSRKAPSVDYTQLGLDVKLYSCQIIYNVALCLAELDYWEEAAEWFEDSPVAADLPKNFSCNLKDAQEAIKKKRPFRLWEISKTAIFRPSQLMVENSEKIDYLGKAKVVYVTSSPVNTPKEDIEASGSPSLSRIQTRPTYPPPAVPCKRPGKVPPKTPPSTFMKSRPVTPPVRSHCPSPKATRDINHKSSAALYSENGFSSDICEKSQINKETEVKVSDGDTRGSDRPLKDSTKISKFIKTFSEIVNDKNEKNDRKLIKNPRTGSQEKLLSDSKEQVGNIKNQLQKTCSAGKLDESLSYDGAFKLTNSTEKCSASEVDAPVRKTINHTNLIPNVSTANVTPRFSPGPKRKAPPLPINRNMIQNHADNKDLVNENKTPSSVDGKIIHGTRPVEYCEVSDAATASSRNRHNIDTTPVKSPTNHSIDESNTKSVSELQKVISSEIMRKFSQPSLSSDRKPLSTNNNSEIPKHVSHSPQRSPKPPRPPPAKKDIIKAAKK